MRIVYDDAKQGLMVNAVRSFMNDLNVKRFLREELGMDRIQMNLIRASLNRFLATKRLSIGEKVTHAHGIGNNCCYPVYYRPEGADEMQQCGNINLNRGLFGEGYVSCEDYNGRRIGPAYKVSHFGVKIEKEE